MNIILKITIYLCSSLICATVLASDFEIHAHNIPDKVHRGEMVFIELEIVSTSATEPQFNRPFLDLVSRASQDKVVKGNAKDAKPWKLAEADLQSGQPFRQIISLRVPAEFPAGDASLVFYIARLGEDESWERAKMLDRTNDAVTDVESLFFSRTIEVLE